MYTSVTVVSHVNELLTSLRTFISDHQRCLFTTTRCQWSLPVVHKLHFVSISKLCFFITFQCHYFVWPHLFQQIHSLSIVHKQQQTATFLFLCMDTRVRHFWTLGWLIIFVTFHLNCYVSSQLGDMWAVPGREWVVGCLLPTRQKN